MDLNGQAQAQISTGLVQTTVLQSLQNVIDMVLEFDIDNDLVRVQTLGSLSFSDCKPLFVAISRLLLELNEVAWGEISSFTVMGILDLINAIELFYRNSVVAFTINASNAASIRQPLTDQLARHYDALFKQSAPVLAYSKLFKDKEADRFEDRAVQIINAMDDQLQYAKDQFLAQEKQAKETIENLDRVLESARNAATEVGITKYAKLFADEATSHDEAAKKWLVATILSALAPVGVAGWYFIDAYQLASSATAGMSLKELQFGLSRVLLFVVSLYVALWCSRSYRVHRHNAVVNKHRQNALATFEAFVDGASDEQTKAAIRIQATTCVFTPQPTGYIQDDRDSDNVAKILEIIRPAK